MIYRNWPVKLIVIAFFLVSCIGNPTEPKPPLLNNSNINYTVFIPSMALETLEIELKINAWDSGESVHVAFPPVYSDNPLLAETENNVHQISIIDSTGNPVACSMDSLLIGPDKSAIASFQNLHFPITITYKVTFNYIDTLFMPPPYIDDNTGYCAGQFIFAVPFTNRELVRIWRDPLDISVNYVTGNSVTFWGDSKQNTKYRNRYELLFSTFALGGELILDNSYNGLGFRIVNLSSEISLTSDFLVDVESVVSDLISDIAGSFGTLGSPITAVLGVVEGGGVEGYHAFAVMRPSESDTLGVFNMVLTHEVLHSWIGVRVGDWEDPWFKEGITNYLGFLIAKRNNHCSQSYFESILLKDLGDFSDVTTYALSDPTNRTWLFSETDGRTELVYVKGAQVGMLLDRRIRDSSTGRPLDRVIGEFVQLYDGMAFYRNEWIDFLESRTGASVSDIFSDYVDIPGAIPDSVLNEACSWLGRQGALGQFALSKKRNSSMSPDNLVRW